MSKKRVETHKILRGCFLIFFTSVECEFSKLYFLPQLVSTSPRTFVTILSLARPCIHGKPMLVLLHSACCMRLKTRLRVLPLDAVSLRWHTWSGWQLFPRCPLVSNLGEMDLGHLWWPFASFALSQGRRWWSAINQRVVTSPVLVGLLARKVRRPAVLTPGTVHFELRPTDNLGTNGGVLKMDTPTQAAGCCFYRDVAS
jgi:hypothetical protein